VLSKSNLADSCAPDTQHAGEELMGERQIITINAIVCHQNQRANRSSIFPCALESAVYAARL
jgi:hypothetical protein